MTEREWEGKEDKEEKEAEEGKASGAGTVGPWISLPMNTTPNASP